MTVALVNQDRENNTEKRSQGLKSEKEALLIGKEILFSSSILSLVIIHLNSIFKLFTSNVLMI